MRLRRGSSREVGVEMPIAGELHQVVYAGKDIRTAFEDIRKRDTKDEDA